jgi:hypothetical protein
VVAGIRQEIRARLREEARPSAIPLGQDDLIKELDGRFIGLRGLDVVDELIEGLCVLHGGDVLCRVVWKALDEAFHVEFVEHAVAALLAFCRAQEAAVGVEKAGEAADEGCADLLGAEGGWAYVCDLL